MLNANECKIKLSKVYVSVEAPERMRQFNSLDFCVEAFSKEVCSISRDRIQVAASSAPSKVRNRAVPPDNLRS